MNITNDMLKEAMEQIWERRGCVDPSHFLRWCLQGTTMRARGRYPTPKNVNDQWKRHCPWYQKSQRR